MDYKDKYKKYVETNFKPQDNFEKLCKEMEINNMKNNNNKNYVKYGLGFLATAVVIGGVVVGFNFIGKGNKTQQVDKLVTLTLNNDNMITDLASATASFDDTSITLSVDKNNKVYSVYGDDQLAKMVIVNESIIGKDVNEALKTIVDIEINTGLIIKGSISGSDNALEISVSAQLSEEAEAYLKQLKETVEQKITNSNIRATVETVKGIALEELTPDYTGQHKLLGDIISEEPVDEKYFINEEQMKKWEYMKGAKKIERTSKTGYSYQFSEGPIAFPDPLDRPARTMLTSEGTANRSSHVIIDKVTGKYRRLTPEECERINGFESGWTDTGTPERQRYFIMGNALVVPLIEKMGEELLDIM